MRIPSYFIAVALMALVAPAMAAPCTPGQRAELVKMGYGEADIKKMCGNASALFEKAYIARESGDLKTAQQLFEQGLRIEPGNALGQKLLAEVKAESLSSAQKLFEQGYNAKQSGDLRTAQQLFEQGLTIEPGNALGQKFLAEVKDALSARKFFEQGYDAKQSGDLRTAQRLFEQGLSIEPGNALGQKYLAEVKEEATRATASSSIAAMSPGTSFRDCEVCPEMVVVPTGSFLMGSPSSEDGWYSDEDPQHRVAISRPFAAGKYEVTFDEWDACVRESGCSHNPGDSSWGRGRRPVINVSWQDAKQYAEWLSRKSGKRYRLLTEAEWEYVARAGTQTAFSTGATIATSQANYGQSRKQTEPVGGYGANAFGLFDVHGNVWEWTEDCWNSNYNGAPSGGAAWLTGDCSRRVIRGGSWSNFPRHVRSARRLGDSSDGRSYFLGFRLVRTLE